LLALLEDRQLLAKEPDFLAEDLDVNKKSGRPDLGKAAAGGT